MPVNKSIKLRGVSDSDVNLRLNRDLKFDELVEKLKSKLAKRNLVADNSQCDAQASGGGRKGTTTKND